MNGLLLYLRSRRIVGVLLGYVAASALLKIAQANELSWSPFGGTAFPIAIILPLGMACLVATAEDSDSRINEILAAKSLAGRHALVSAGYVISGCLIIFVVLGTEYRQVSSILQYDATVVVRNFLLLTGVAWVCVPALGGRQACLVPALLAGLATTVFSGAVSPPRWNLLLLDNTAPEYVTALVLLIVGIGLLVSSRASLRPSPTI